MPGAPQSARHQQSTSSGGNGGISSPGPRHVILSAGTSEMVNQGATSIGGRPSVGSGSTGGHAGGGSASGSGSGSNGSIGGDQSSHSASYQHHRSATMTSARPPSRFTNYADGLTHPRSYSTVATMDLDESLRALYFAPVPLIVLDSTRTIKMLNKPAESVLGLSDTTSIGQRLERYVAQTSRQHYHVALNEAVQKAGSSTLTTSIPYSTRVSMQSSDDKPSVHVDLSITAWFATDPIFSMTPAPASVSNEASPASYNSPSSPMDHSTRSSGTVNSHPVHEAYYTLYIVPAARSTVRRNSPSSTQTAVIEQLKYSVLDNIDMPMMTVSRDTKIVVQNEACRQTLRVFKEGSGGDLVPSPKETQSGEDMEVESSENDANFSWIENAMVCYDEKFEKTLEQSDWPIYKCAVLGQMAPPIIMGIEVKANNERLIFEISGKPMRSRGGYGEHIGGVVTLRNITAERLKIRQEVRSEGDLYFRQTCDAMPQLVWVASASGYVEWYSKSWYDYTGTDEMGSRGVGWQQSIHAEDFPEAAKRWSYSLRTGELYETAYRVQRYDGFYRWFLGRALPMRDPDTGKTQKWFGTCTDIHDQVEALANSRRAQSQLENVINHAAMTIWATDREGRITVAEGPGVRQLKLTMPGTPGSSERGMQQQRSTEDASDSGNGSHSNSNANSVHSHPRQQMIGRSIYSIWDPALIGKSMEKALSGEVVVEEMEIEGRWFRTSYTPMRAQSSGLTDLIDNVRDNADEGDGEIIGVVGASLDITDRKRAQERVEESLMEKTRALAAEGAAREASRLKSEFLANMSHEIRTPIAGVIGLSELLLDEKGLTPQQRDYAETIQRSAEGLLTVINDVLDFSKVEIGKLDVEKAPFNLEVLLRDAKRMLSFATQKKGLEFREAVGLTYKGQVLGDVGRLRQVITNLLTNAIKFTAEGFISLEVTEMSETAEDLVVKFDVRDSGCGINPVTLSRLFQPFSQADPSTARRFGGTGLGLSISKNLVELMKGTIGLDSVEGNGSHAWFIIPFRKAADVSRISSSNSSGNSISATPATPASGFSMGTSDAEKATLIRPRKDIWILIAEDNVVNAQIASKNIKRMGFNCRTADNGLKALEELERHTYDAILMDCQMPECDGYEATRLIRRSPNADIRMLPIIALTASAIKGDRERALEAGMVDYLAKPVKRPALEATLCRWLYDSDARQSLSQYMEPVDSSSTASAAATTTASFEAFGHLLQDMRGPLHTASTVSSSGLGGAEFPFPEVLNSATPRTIALAAGAGMVLGSEVMSPSTTQRLANVRLSPPSEAVIERLKTPDEQLGTEALSLFRGGDALSAAAVLLSARRASAEEVDRLRREAQQNERPSSSPRSFSYQGKSSTSISSGGGLGGAHVKFAEPAAAHQQHLASSAGDDGVLPSRDAFPLFRRSSREQDGLGRDLDAEMMRAAMSAEPALHEAMSSGEDVTMDSATAENIAAIDHS